MHSCPGCGQACYCGGDIDDIPLDGPEADACTHCPEDWDGGPDEYDAAPPPDADGRRTTP